MYFLRGYMGSVILFQLTGPKNFQQQLSHSTETSAWHISGFRLLIVQDGWRWEEKRLQQTEQELQFWHESMTPLLLRIKQKFSAPTAYTQG